MNDKPINNPNSDVLKQFLLSLVATTISIALTFGIASLIDNKKKEDAKREIVLMVMYDMQQTVDLVAECDSNLVTFFNNHVDLVANPEKFHETIKLLTPYVPKAVFPPTTENIFNSSIETINTVGSILFVQYVSSFYTIRKQYKETVIDDFQKNMEDKFVSYNNMVSFESDTYPVLSHSMLREMEKLLNQCKVLMKVSDKELEAFAEGQKKLLETTSDRDSDEEVLLDFTNFSERVEQMNQAKEQGRKKLKQQ